MKLAPRISFYEATARQRVAGLLDPGSFREIVPPTEKRTSPHLGMFDAPVAFDDGVVIGEGTHSVRCTLTPTRNGFAYAGNAMGREIVYERSREKVQADIEMANPNLRRPRAR